MRKPPDYSKGRSKYQRERILAALKVRPMDPHELADKLHLSRDAINLHLRAMRTSTPKVVHVIGHNVNPKGGPVRMIHAPGDKPDAVYVRASEKSPRRTPEEARELILGELAAGPKTTRQVSAKLGCVEGWTRALLLALRAEGKVRIGAWVRLPVGCAPAYVLGGGEDAPRELPPKPTRAARARRHRELAFAALFSQPGI